MLCVVPLNNIQRSSIIRQCLPPRRQESWLPWPALPVPSLFWLCLGHMTSMFLFLCYYSMWQSRGTPSKTCALFERAAKDQLSLALVSNCRDSKTPVSSGQAACRSAWSTDAQELNPQGNSHSCSSIYFQPQCSASTG